MPLATELALNTVETGRSAFAYLIPALVALGGLANSVKRIPRGHVGQLQRNHKPVVHLVDGEESFRQFGPGIRMRVPIWESVQSISVQHRNNDLDVLTVEPADGGYQICVKSSITWRVSEGNADVHRALFLAQNEAELTRIVVNECGAGLSGVLSQLEGVVSVNDIDVHSVIGNTKTACTGRLKTYGVELIEMQIQSLNRSPAQVLADGISTSSLAGLIEAPHIPR